MTKAPTHTADVLARAAPVSSTHAELLLPGWVMTAALDVEVFKLWTVAAATPPTPDGRGRYLVRTSKLGLGRLAALRDLLFGMTGDRGLTMHRRGVALALMHKADEVAEAWVIRAGELQARAELLAAEAKRLEPILAQAQDAVRTQLQLAETDLATVTDELHVMAAKPHQRALGESYARKGMHLACAAMALSVWEEATADEPAQAPRCLRMAANVLHRYLSDSTGHSQPLDGALREWLRDEARRQLETLLAIARPLGMHGEVAVIASTYTLGGCRPEYPMTAHLETEA